MSRSAAEKLLEDVAERFDAKVRRGRFRALCPAHPDTAPSLHGTIGEHGDRVLIHCFGGCTPEAVVEARGLTMADLFVRRAGQRPESKLRAARVLRPDRRQWVKDVLVSKLPADVADIFGDPEIRRLYPSARSKDSLERSLRRLATSLGVVSRKRGFKSGWRWELPQRHEGDTTLGAKAQETQEDCEGDTRPGRDTHGDGQIGPFAPSQEVRETREGDSSPPGRYERRRLLVGSAFGVAGRQAVDPETRKVVADVSELFVCASATVRPWDAELERWWGACRAAESSPPEKKDVHNGIAAALVCGGCSRCGDARAVGLYARVRPGFWLCARCWRSAGGRGEGTAARFERSPADSGNEGRLSDVR